jgi:hydrogenase-4 component F
MDSIILAIVLVPTIAGLLAFAIPRDVGRRGHLILAALVHLGLVIWTWVHPLPPPASGQWVALDEAGKLFLTLTSILFLASSIYCWGYLSRERDPEFAHREGAPNEPENIFTGCMLLFLAAMSLVTVSQNLGLLWVAIEATTLASAPLIYFHRNKQSLEATWKYLLICSVGIALALLGNFLLAVATESLTLPEGLLLIDVLGQAKSIDSMWLKAAFILVLVGYGTKMGLAPMYSALPDADSEAPAAVGALLSGCLLNCAFLGILRFYQIAAAAGEAAFCGNLLVGVGLVSMAVAAIFVLGQTDFRRMLAYSSIEHMGILALGVGLGAWQFANSSASPDKALYMLGAFGAALHACCHSFTKGALFLISGVIRQSYGTRWTYEVRGLYRAMPLTGTLWVACILAIVGAPPFGLFLSEFTILRAALDQGQYLIAAAYLSLLALVFIGIINAALGMAQGEPLPDTVREDLPEPLWQLLPAAALCLLVLGAGLYLPADVQATLRNVAISWGGGK